jgi:hypothetical protein
LDNRGCWYVKGYVYKIKHKTQQLHKRSNRYIVTALYVNVRFY